MDFDDVWSNGSWINFKMDMEEINEMKILVLGHGEHGKDTFAGLLSERFRLRFESSSRTAFYAIRPVLNEIFPHKTDEELYEERRINRELWRSLIELLNFADRSMLCRLILDVNDMYVGMRSLAEYKASKDLFDKIYYVDASIRKPKDPSMQIPFNPDEMIMINNNGNEENLKQIIGGLK